MRIPNIMLESLSLALSLDDLLRGLSSWHETCCVHSSKNHRFKSELIIRIQSIWSFIGSQTPKRWSSGSITYTLDCKYYPLCLCAILLFTKKRANEMGLLHKNGNEHKDRPLFCFCFERDSLFHVTYAGWTVRTTWNVTYLDKQWQTCQWEELRYKTQTTRTHFSSCIFSPQFSTKMSKKNWWP